MTRLSAMCQNDCGKPHAYVSFMLGSERWNFCSQNCLMEKLTQLQCTTVNGHNFNAKEESNV